MKKVLFSIMAAIAVCTFAACSNGDYIANPSAASNESINPMDQLDSAGFNWSGTNSMSANINGSPWGVDSTHTTFAVTHGTNIIAGLSGISHGFILNLNEVYGGNIYPLGYSNSYRYIAYYDSVATGPVGYYSYFGNVGQVQIIRNDAARIIGRFHFQGLNMVNGSLINVSNGWFNIGK